ncbi:MAG: cation transporter, partial [Clostridia bacterium]|nr:cation transporter [Clostridia bacterium]
MKKTWPIEIDCPNCAAKLERALAELPGVVHLSVNYVQKRITLEAADDQFAAVTAAVLAKTAEIEPDTVIHADGTEAHHEHHHGCYDDHCGCGHDHHDHEHHHEHRHDHDHAHHHEHAPNAGKTLLIRIVLAILL